MKPAITLGVDTHAHFHAVAALDPLGQLVGALTIPATPAGYSQLLSWALSLGDLHQVGLEGPGSYGAGLSRFLVSHGIKVLEVQRPNRQHRRRRGKSDPSDAESAARSAQAGTYLGIPKSSDGAVESIRVLSAAKRSAIKARTQASNQLRAFVVTAPDDLRRRLSPLSPPELVRISARFRTSSKSTATVPSSTRLALRSVACRYLSLSAEISALEDTIQDLIIETAPQLLALPGIGPDTAASLLLAAGDNPQRLLSESSFASLCGVSPVSASSGKIQRHRLNRGGNRDANRALHIIALSRMSFDQRTKTYVARRTAEGKSKREIMRCLKRYISREVYKVLLRS